MLKSHVNSGQRAPSQNVTNEKMISGLIVMLRFFPRLSVKALSLSFKMATTTYEASYKKYFGNRFENISKNSSDEEIRHLYDKWAADYDKVYKTAC